MKITKINNNTIGATLAHAYNAFRQCGVGAPVNNQGIQLRQYADRPGHPSGEIRVHLEITSQDHPGFMVRLTGPATPSRHAGDMCWFDPSSGPDRALEEIIKAICVEDEVTPAIPFYGEVVTLVDPNDMPDTFTPGGAAIVVGMDPLTKDLIAYRRHHKLPEFTLDSYPAAAVASGELVKVPKEVGDAVRLEYLVACRGVTGLASVIDTDALQRAWEK